MRWLPLLAVGFALSVAADSPPAQKTVGRVTFRAELGHAYPGGLIVARVVSRTRLGTVHAILDGRRSVLYDGREGPRALVPIPADATPGPATLGFEIFTRRGRQRVPLEVEIAPRQYAPRTVAIPETRRHLPRQPGVAVEARQMLLLLRTHTRAALWQGFRPPVEAAPVASFGAPQSYLGGSPIESLVDGVFGERHRGLDYEVPEGTVVQAPAAGTVLSASLRALSGHTLVLDHGQGVVSMLAHLGRLDVREGQAVEGRAPVALSGSSGIAYAPHVHWAVYVNGIAIDPRVMETLTN